MKKVKCFSATVCCHLKHFYIFGVMLMYPDSYRDSIFLKCKTCLHAAGVNRKEK
jgi:hypothetical protein